MIRIARGINKKLGRQGAVFAERYHVRVLGTPREVRNVLRYVYLNARHHDAQAGAARARSRPSIELARRPVSNEHSACFKPFGVPAGEARARGVNPARK